MKKLLLYVVCYILYINNFMVIAQEKRNFLKNKYSESDIGILLNRDTKWIKYPCYDNRKAWQELPNKVREEYVKRGEKYIGYAWPSILATDYLEFTRSGNRQIMERPYNERRSALLSLAMAELVEGKGRFMDDLINGIFSYCEQTYWGYSAHFYMYTGERSPGAGAPLTILPDIENPIIDLGVGEISADFAWIHFLFGNAFEKISPVINQRIKRELRMRVLEPFYERMDYWWITGWNKGLVNNWNPWCNFNVLNVALLMEEDMEKKAKLVYKTMVSVDLFYNSYPNDGACDEGPSYWSAAGAKAFEYLDLLYAASDGKINIFDKKLIHDIGRYIYRVYIAQGMYFANFADAPAKLNQRGGNIYRYGDRIGDETMKEFGTFFLYRNELSNQVPGGPLAAVMADLFGLEGWRDVKPLEPLIGEYYFPDMQIAIARNQEGSNKGFYFAAKGGNNGEAHNHNDVGTGIVFYNGSPVFVDVGVGTYTAKTFSKDRYDIWTMSSYYHNVPLINGKIQSPGKQFAAFGSDFQVTPSEVIFKTDISKAYPTDAFVEKWIREYRIVRNEKMIISDDYCLSREYGKTELHFMTPLESESLRPGELELSNKEIKVLLRYNPSHYKISVKRKDMDDSKLQRVWGSHLNMVCLEKIGGLSGKHSFELVPVK